MVESTSGEAPITNEPFGLGAHFQARQLTQPLPETGLPPAHRTIEIVEVLPLHQQERYEYWRQRNQRYKVRTVASTSRPDLIGRTTTVQESTLREKFVLQFELSPEEALRPDRSPARFSGRENTRLGTGSGPLLAGMIFSTTDKRDAGRQVKITAELPHGIAHAERLRSAAAHDVEFPTQKLIYPALREKLTVYSVVEISRPHRLAQEEVSVRTNKLSEQNLLTRWVYEGLDLSGAVAEA